MKRPRMMTTRAAARMLGVPARTLRLWNEGGIGPMPYRGGRYDRADVEAWAEEARAAVLLLRDVDMMTASADIPPCRHEGR